MQALIDAERKVVRYPILGYRVNIRNNEDYQKVQEMAKQLKIL